MWTIISFCCLVFVGVQGEPGPELWRLEASTHHRIVRDLEDSGDVDVWGHSQDHAQVLVEPEAKSRVTRALEEAGISHLVEVEDVLGLVEEQRAQRRKRSTRSKRAAQALDWNSYHDMNDIESFINWVNVTGGDFVQVIPAAVTEEGRQVLVVHVSDPTVPEPKKKIWIEGGIHAREWISPAVTTYILYQLVTEWRDMLQVTDWYIVPVANPDGYQYTFSDNNRARMWRKNRRNNHARNGRCKGVDLNRNWNLKWGVGASSDPCSETYKGPVPFSEPETDGLQKVMTSIGDMDLFITFHSFGQTILYPWGWTNNAPANAKQLNHLAKKFADKVKDTSGGKIDYKIGGSGPLYGLASGATDDWAYGRLGVPFSYTIELPDEGRHGFLLPENRISSTVIETAAGVQCMVSYLANFGSCARRKTRTRQPIVTPRQQNYTPGQLSFAPRQENLNPREQNFTPREQNFTPREHNLTPRQLSFISRQNHALFRG
ncbi:carboxypeptidase B-like isoform X2 [Homarus americanus]|uniref:Carboxypeptidase B-like 2 n=2 Tax=Homarus americanus TaxID=6706 RepID=A0A8J5JJ12_HOMAM|nr:carboxypeptidase B-like isoform X2 [Homarus americanus]XP_042203469.1 carboxypeptidase B-like isoform X2 [Homarus americanus]KAG7156595.1 Carboxypeptidase B-like 2 [Homarus americanus]